MKRRLTLVFAVLLMMLPLLASGAPRPSETDGYRFTFAGCDAVVHRIVDGERDLHGVMYLPKNFDEGKQYPLLIMSHGYNSSSYADTDYLSFLTEMGILCYKFDFVGGSIRSRSGGDMLDMSLMTEKDDLLCVMEHMTALPFVDAGRVALMGMSQGGAVTGLAAWEVGDRIRGEILVYPAFSILDDARKTYASPAEMPDQVLLLNQYVGRKYYEDVWSLDLLAEAAKYTGPVLLLHGTADKLVDVSVSQAAEKAFVNARLVMLEGAPHGFGKKDVAAVMPEIEAFLREIGLIL